MRRLIIVGAIALAALAVGKYAIAGSTTGGPTAFALVDPSGPRLVTERTAGFVDVHVGPFGPGDYCLVPARNVNVRTTAAVSSEEAFYSNLAGVVTVRYPTAGPACPDGELEVKTFTTDGTALSDQIGFTVLVP